MKKKEGIKKLIGRKIPRSILMKRWKHLFNDTPLPKNLDAFVVSKRYVYSGFFFPPIQHPNHIILIRVNESKGFFNLVLDHELAHMYYYLRVKHGR